MGVVKRGTYIEISMAKELLEANGIRCLVKSEHGEGFVIKTGNFFEEYTLYVMQCDLDIAMSICESFF